MVYFVVCTAEVRKEKARQLVGFTNGDYLGGGEVPRGGLFGRGGVDPAEAQKDENSRGEGYLKGGLLGSSERCLGFTLWFVPQKHKKKRGMAAGRRVCKEVFLGEGRGSAEGSFRRRGYLSVVGPAEASEEEKWPQTVDPEMLSRIDRTTDRQHNRIEYCLLRLYGRVEA